MKKNTRTVMSGGQIGLTVLCAFLALILIAMIFVTAYADYYFGLINYIPEETNITLSSDAIASLESKWNAEDATGETETENPTIETVRPEEATQPSFVPETFIQHKDLINILVVGQDRRPGEGRTRSDTMIVVSINKRNQVISLTSFMRDMYVNIPGLGYNKMNSAYSANGFPMLCDTLMSNFGIVIDGCVEVDFSGFEAIIDTLGGVNMYVTAAEARQINMYHGTNLKEGMNLLDGKAALGYARERYNIGDDFGRTERQRKLLTEMINMCKDLSLSEMNDLLETMLPMISTNMSTKKITNYLIEIFPMISQAKIQQLRIPASGTYENVKVIGGVGDVLLPDLAANQKLLAEKLLPK